MEKAVRGIEFGGNSRVTSWLCPSFDKKYCMGRGLGLGWESDKLGMMSAYGRRVWVSDTCIVVE